MAEQLTWRQATKEDEVFLLALFAAQQQTEFAPLGFSRQELEPLIAMQFRARHTGYAQTYPAAIDIILCKADGTPVGRHLVERQQDAYRSIDLAVLPEFQNQGIGGWALRQMQRLAAAQSLPFRLRVLRSNPALRLYTRLGFLRVSGDEIAYEMEWQGQTVSRPTSTEPILSPGFGQSSDFGPKQDQLTGCILSFVRAIGLEVHLGPVPSSTFLPGIQIVSNGLRVDCDRLLYPGDLLHEAGHLAVMPPERRAAEFPQVGDPGEEMAVLAWSYAATVHLNLPPQVVFHPNGYRGQANALIEEFQAGRCIGLPLLGWMGFTTQPLPQKPSIYPRMLRWLREEQVQETRSEPSVDIARK